MAVMLPTKDDRPETHADTAALNGQQFEPELTAFEQAWLRKLELRYVTAGHHVARTMAVIDGAFSAPTQRCKLLAGWLQQLEREASVKLSESEEVTGGPSVARLLTRRPSVAPSTVPPAT